MSRLETAGLWIWVTGGDAYVMRAKDREDAYRRAIANRVASRQDVASAILWFRQNDKLFPVEGEVTDQPYAGELPDDPYDLIEEEDEDE